jgi:transcriptional regulator with XRE-family HTH domain/quercetin dioxygenase-like cupin family protein
MPKPESGVPEEAVTNGAKSPPPGERQGGGSESGPTSVGQRLRTERERQRIGLRELARRVDVSASLISQIELGRATPSVGTLYAIVNELNMSLDELFFEASGMASAANQSQVASVDNARRPQPPSPSTDGNEDAAGPASARSVGSKAPSPNAGGPVVRSGERQVIQLEAGVTWERLTPATERGVDFLYVIYEVGGASAPENSLIRHMGREYGHLLEGRLGVTVGFETYELLPGDSISFASTTPHRLYNIGATPVRAIWLTLGRDDPEVRHGV